MPDSGTTWDSSAGPWQSKDYVPRDVRRRQIRWLRHAHSRIGLLHRLQDALGARHTGSTRVQRFPGTGSGSGSPWPQPGTP